MSDCCDITFHVTNLRAAIDWYRRSYRTNVAFVGRCLALLQLGGVTVTLMLREDVLRRDDARSVGLREVADQPNNFLSTAVV